MSGLTSNVFATGTFAPPHLTFLTRLLSAAPNLDTGYWNVSLPVPKQVGTTSRSIETHRTCSTRGSNLTQSPPARARDRKVSRSASRLSTELRRQRKKMPSKTFRNKKALACERWRKVCPRRNNNYYYVSRYQWDK